MDAHLKSRGGTSVYCLRLTVTEDSVLLLVTELTASIEQY